MRFIHGCSSSPPFPGCLVNSLSFLVFEKLHFFCVRGWVGRGEQMQFVCYSMLPYDFLEVSLSEIAVS